MVTAHFPSDAPQPTPWSFGCSVKMGLDQRSFPVRVYFYPGFTHIKIMLPFRILLSRMVGRKRDKLLDNHAYLEILSVCSEVLLHLPRAATASGDKIQVLLQHFKHLSSPGRLRPKPRSGFRENHAILQYSGFLSTRHFSGD